MMKMRPTVLLSASLAAALLAAGCSSPSSTMDVPPASLPPAPLDPVQSGTLDPVTGQPTDATQQGLEQQGDTTVANIDANTGGQLAQPTSSEPISRESMAGTWTVASDNPECRIILAFTKWSGGYRAATRRCNAAELSSVTAWDVDGNQVVLVDSTGNKVATLYSTGPERYQGQTTNGQPVIFSR